MSLNESRSNNTDEETADVEGWTLGRADSEPTSEAIRPQNIPRPDLIGGSQVVLYPTIAYRHPKRDEVRVLVQGRVFHASPLPLAKRLLLRGLQRTLKLPPGAVHSPIFKERTDGFLVSPESGLRPLLEVGGHTLRLRRKSKGGSGLFFAKADLPAAVCQQLDCHPSTAQDQRIQISCSFLEGAVTGGGDVYFSSERGVSIISDIDDTIKHTSVTSRRHMLERTFLLPFESIDGMAEVYQNWAAQGASFHYASSSPWQLYHPLRSFLDAGGFPSGSVHLRWFRIRDEMFKRWRLLRKKSSKIGVINGIIKRLPKRRFVLVGDSGERDPEIYAKLARKYPNRVHSILIRNLSERPVDPERQQRLDARRGDVPLILFHDASDLAAIELPALTR